MYRLSHYLPEGITSAHSMTSTGPLNVVVAPLGVFVTQLSDKQ